MKKLLIIGSVLVSGVMGLLGLAQEGRAAAYCKNPAAYQKCVDSGKSATLCYSLYCVIGSLPTTDEK